jgi:hypothetical protein
MIGKKEDTRLVDLEYMIPKEHKAEAVAPLSEPEQTTLTIKESCCDCGKDSEEIVLLPIFHQGIDKWMCPKCLKGHFEAYTPSYNYGSNSSESYNSEEYSSTEPSNSSSDSPMSIFD